MGTIYIFIVVVLLVLAVGGLVVGVSNDAVNFLNSAQGSHAASRKVILAVASVGIVIGALTSSGMMEVARSGVFYPQNFTFREVMLLFLGVMFANVILLDVFNSLGLPTSTTVSLVFGLLGSAIAVTAVKINNDPTLTSADMSQFINSGKALVIISAILSSVVIAFVTGSLLMWVSRVIFTFRYEKIFKRFGSLWCGLAFTVIIYFAIFKGLESSGIMSEEFLNWVSNNSVLAFMAVFAASTGLMALLQLMKVNILKITILAGTFSLSLAFAGNDLVNFIGVPIAGYDSYKIALQAGGNPDMLMGALNNPVKADILFLLIAGIVMVITLCTSKKAQHVSDTEINLSRQDEGTERFGSTGFSRAIVRISLGFNRWIEDHTPKRAQQAIASRFEQPQHTDTKNRAQYDLIRATVNLTASSMLIVLATSLKLPLSTTYVTFMVAMGTSLADKAWGRESAVYRITGVITVIAGWFITALVAFIIALLITFLLLWGGTIAIIFMAALCAFLFIESSHLVGRKKNRSTEEAKAKIAKAECGDDILNQIVGEVCKTMEETTDIYQSTIEATLKEDRKSLRDLVRRSNDLFYAARERKYEMLPTLQKFKENYIDTGHYYVQVVDYLSEMTKALVHITRPCYEHIDNNHRGMSEEQVADLLTINRSVSNIYAHINQMLKENDFSQLDRVLAMRDDLFDLIAQAIKNQLRRIQTNSTSTKASVLYLTILTETKNMILQSRNLLKSQKYFVAAQQTEEQEAEEEMSRFSRRQSAARTK